MMRDPAAGDIIMPSEWPPCGLVGEFTYALFTHEGYIDRDTLGTVISVMPATHLMPGARVQHRHGALVAIIVSSVGLLHAVWFYPGKASQFIAIVVAAS